MDFNNQLGNLPLVLFSSKISVTFITASSFSFIKYKRHGPSPVPYLPGSAVDNQTVELAKKIKGNYGVEPIVHLTCLHYGKDEIGAILDQLKENGIENVLALTTDIHHALNLRPICHRHDSRFHRNVNPCNPGLFIKAVKCVIIKKQLGDPRVAGRICDGIRHLV